MGIAHFADNEAELLGHDNQALRILSSIRYQIQVDFHSALWRLKYWV